MPYGDSQTLDQLQAAAPMSMTAADTPQSPPVQSTPPDIIPLDAPSARPDEPVTAGADGGAGPGPEVLSTNQNQQNPQASYGQLTTMLQQMAGGDTTGSIAALAMAAAQRGL